MLGRALRQPLTAIALVGCSIGCAELIGLDDLDGSASGGAGGATSGGAGSDLGGGEATGGDGIGGAGSGGDEAESGGAPSTGGGGTGGTASGGGASGGGGSPAGGGSDGTGGDGTGGGGPDCTYDDFVDAEHTSACWSTFNAELLFGEYTLDTTEGELIARPDFGRAWYNGDSAFLLYQEITGNFVLETRVWVHATGYEREVLPDVQFAEAGILAFPAAAPLADLGPPFTGYYAIKAGTLSTPGEAGYKGEHTALDASVTSVVDDEHDVDDGSWNGAFLRLCRVGNLLWTGFLPAGEAEWQVLDASVGADGYDTTSPELTPLTPTLYVGLLAEVWDGTATDGEVGVTFSHAQFSTPDDWDDCWSSWIE